MKGFYLSENGVCIIAAQCDEKSEHNFKVVEEILVFSYVFRCVVISLVLTITVGYCVRKVFAGS